MPSPPSRAPENAPSDYVRYSASEGPFWAMEANAERPIRFAETGPASERETPTSTLVQVFEKAAREKPDKIALRTEDMPPLRPGEEPPAPLPLERWKSWTWKAYLEDSRRVAKGLMAVGHEQHDAVNVFGFNSPEWFLAMMGCIIAGGACAGIYPSDGEDQVQFKSFHANASVAFVGSAEAFTKFASVAEDLPYLKAIVAWGTPSPDDITRSDGSVVRAFSFFEFWRMGDEEVDDAALDARVARIKPTHCCALIYTSGTTGHPKACMITHDNLLFEVSSALPLSGIGLKAEEERIISYLPLSHIAGIMADVVSPIVVTANMKAWVSSSFARSYDLKVGSLGQRLGAVEPTFFLGVPRVWEKIAEKLQAIGAKNTGLKKVLGTAAKKRGLKASLNQQVGGSGKSPSMGPLGIYRTLLNVIKMKLGLAKAKFTCSGAAPLAMETLRYFASLGIVIKEVYGQSECTVAATWTSNSCFQFGTVGFELPGVEVRCFKIGPDGTKTECPRAVNINNPSEEEQGELCYRGRNIMLGYMANPKLGEEHVEEIRKKNEDAIDSEGWLHSGDKGAVSALGMVRITGRYKEIIIGAGGENIAPVPIEDALKQAVPAISNVMMIGDKRKFNVVLVTLKAKGATGELPGGSELDFPATEFGLTIGGAVSKGKVVETIAQALKTVGDDSTVTPSNAAKVQKFTILPSDFSVMTGELTATLKLKRSVVADKYASIIEALYASDDVFVPFTEVGSYDLDDEQVVSSTDDRVGSFKLTGNVQSLVFDEEAIQSALDDGDDDDDDSV